MELAQLPTLGRYLMNHHLMHSGKEVIEDVAWVMRDGEMLVGVAALEGITGPILRVTAGVAGLVPLGSHVHNEICRMNTELFYGRFFTYEDPNGSACAVLGQLIIPAALLDLQRQETIHAALGMIGTFNKDASRLSAFVLSHFGGRPFLDDDVPFLLNVNPRPAE